MQNTTPSAPVQAGKITGVELKQETFKHAIEKALTIKPRVEFVSLAKAMVETASHTGQVCVSFAPYGSGLWVNCSCQFYHSMYNRRDYPRACFHAAAAALARNLFAIPQPIGAIVEEKHLESTTYDTAQRTRSVQQKQDRFRPHAVPTAHSVRDAIHWIDNYVGDLTDETFRNRYSADLLNYLCDKGYVGFDSGLLYIIQCPIQPVAPVPVKSHRKSAYSIDGWDL